jgi:hypothetical protein
MQDRKLLEELLEAESEQEAVSILEANNLLNDSSRWRFLGNMPNNESIALAQASSPTAALVEKITNGIDAILLKHCKSQGIDPRGQEAPKSMAKSIEKFFGEAPEENTRKG